MKFNIFFLALVFGIFSLASCDKEDGHNHSDDTFQYHAHIMKPDSADKMIGQTMHIHVDFEEHDSKTIHNVQVRIYNTDDNTTIETVDGEEFGKMIHVHDESGAYSYHKDVPLTTENGFVGHGNYILEAIVHDHDGKHEAKESVAFHVHPM